MSPSTMKTGARKKGRREESVSGGETEKWVKLSVDPPLHFSSSLWSLPDMCFYFWFFFFFFLLTLHVFKKKKLFPVPSEFLPEKYICWGTSRESSEGGELISGTET